MPKGIPNSGPGCAVKECDGRHEAKGYCNKHYLHWKKHGYPVPKERTVEERFWSYVDRDGPLSEFAPHLGPCWIWTNKPNPDGYGVFGVGTSNGKQLNRLAYNWSWELKHGPIPTGMQLDHLCRVRLCVNPGHLEVVTPSENVRRGLVSDLRATCPQGHPFTAENTYVRPDDGYRRCRVCMRAQGARRRERDRAS